MTQQREAIALVAESFTVYPPQPASQPAAQQPLGLDKVVPMPTQLVAKQAGRHAGRHAGRQVRRHAGKQAGATHLDAVVRGVAGTPILAPVLQLGDCLGGQQLGADAGPVIRKPAGASAQSRVQDTGSGQSRAGQVQVQEQAGTSSAAVNTFSQQS